MSVDIDRPHCSSLPHQPLIGEVSIIGQLAEGSAD
jgi:hypothetical protein